MVAANYTFFLNNLKINSKMSNNDYVDKDWLVFSVSVNGRQFLATACSTIAGGEPPQIAAQNPFYVDGYIGLAKNGDDLLLCNQPPSAGPFPSNGEVPPATDLVNGWVVGPLTIADDDAVVVTYMITNLSYDDPSQMAQDALKYGGAVLAAVGGLLGTATAGISAIIGGILNGVAQALASVIGSSQNNCNGPVALSPSLVFTGSQLETMVNTAVPNQQNISQFTTTIVNSGLTQPTQGGCWIPNTDVTWSILRDIASQQVFGSTPPPVAGQLKPLGLSLSTQDWEGTWGDEEFEQNSRILCIIGASGSGITGASDEERASSYAAGLIDTFQREAMSASLVGQDPRAARVGALATLSVPAVARSLAPQIDAVMPPTARYSADITEHLGSPDGPIAEQIAANNLVEIPMLALPFTSDVYAPLTPPFAEPGGATIARPVASEGILANTATLDSVDGSATARENILAPSRPVVGRQSVLVPLLYAATLVSSADSSLQLYGEIDSTGKITGHRIRYLRANNNVIVTDVVLTPAQQMPT